MGWNETGQLTMEEATELTEVIQQIRKEEATAFKNKQK